jgi:hypothetical protein
MVRVFSTVMAISC